MSTTRLAGNWRLYFASVETAAEGLSVSAPTSADLAVEVANRAGVEARVTLAGSEIRVRGRIRPGTPSVITLDEVGSNDEPVDNGFEAILYVPPWRPNIDYDYDILCGTAVIGAASAIGGESLRDRVLTVTGLQAIE
jgi:hypothetical protein